VTPARRKASQRRSIQAKGIEPDIVVADGREVIEGHAGPLREKDIERHLRGENEEKDDPGQKAAPPAPKGKKEDPSSRKNGKKGAAQGEEARKEDAKDPQLERATELLKGWEIFKSRFIDKPKPS
jgi:carboxyl-terminal processing protease